MITNGLFFNDVFIALVTFELMCLLFIIFLADNLRSRNDESDYQKKME